MEPKEALKMLGLPEDADEAQVKAVTKKLLRQNHPDGTRNPEEKEDRLKTFPRVMEARDVALAHVRRANESADPQPSDPDGTAIGANSTKASDGEPTFSPRMTAADRLEAVGGFVLLASGVGLITLAAVLADQPAVASIFAILGPGLLVLAAFYSRIEGSVEATRDGVKMGVRQMKVAASYVLTEAERVSMSPSESAEAIALAGDRLEAAAGTPAEFGRAGEYAASEAVKTVAEKRHLDPKEPAAREERRLDPKESRKS